MSDPHGLCCYLLLYQQDFLHPIDFMQLDLDHFPHSCGHSASYECSFDGQLAMAAIDQYTKLHPARTAMRKQRVQCGSNRAPGEQHIIGALQPQLGQPQVEGHIDAFR